MELGSIDLTQVYNHVITGLLGAGVYNGLTFIGKAKKSGDAYDLRKLLRTASAGLLSAGASVGINYTPPENMGYYDQLLTYVGASWGLDNVMKILGWKVADKT